MESCSVFTSIDSTRWRCRRTAKPLLIILSIGRVRPPRRWLTAYKISRNAMETRYDHPTNTYNCNIVRRLPQPMVQVSQQPDTQPVNASHQQTASTPIEKAQTHLPVPPFRPAETARDEPSHHNRRHHGIPRPSSIPNRKRPVLAIASRIQIRIATTAPAETGLAPERQINRYDPPAHPYSP